MKTFLKILTLFIADFASLQVEPPNDGRGARRWCQILPARMVNPC